MRTLSGPGLQTFENFHQPVINKQAVLVSEQLFPFLLDPNGRPLVLSHLEYEHFEHWLVDEAHGFSHLPLVNLDHQVSKKLVEVVF